jgi:aldose sugar dehydrogenase
MFVSRLFLLLILAVSFISISYFPYIATAQPVVNDPNLKIQVIFKGLKKPTSMAFLGPNDILVLEKDKGTVQRIINGRMLPNPVLDVKVANKFERGMLGIAVAGRHAVNSSGSASNPKTYVFLYYTESEQDGDDNCPRPSYCVPGHDPLGNRLYRYQLVNNKLVNPKLLLDLPASKGAAHNGGAIILGPDNNIYVPIGEVSFTKTLASNIKNGLPPDGRGGILRVTQDGKPVGDGILGHKYPLNLYYAYGIRNSFGIDFDPVTKKLWDTENGPGFGDEINLVNPGFNSGWKKVQGIWERRSYFGGPIALEPEKLLVSLNGKGKYSAPEFIWNHTVGPTAIKFFNSDKLGKQYKNDMFVASLLPNGTIYHFELNKDRTQLVLHGPLKDKIADSIEELEGIIFAKDFGGVTDIEVGPYDGYLYIVSYDKGTIFRIVP